MILNSISNIKVDPTVQYIWLASWYPSKSDRFNGDFIQRHAKAFSLQRKLILIHIIHQYNTKNLYSVEISIDGNLTQIILYIGMRGRIDHFLSKIQYNIKYHLIGWKLIKKILFQLRNPKLIHVHVPIKMGRLAWLVKKKYNIPFILSEHFGRYLTSDIDSFENRNILYQYSLKKIIENSIAVIQVSEYMVQKFCKLFNLTNQHIIRNVVDERTFHHMPVVNEKFTFIHVSNLEQVKNFSGILEACKILYEKRQDFILTVIANNEFAVDDITNENEEYSFLNIQGSMSYENVAQFMKRSDCMILFSRNENFPCVIIEALCCGLPVIASDVGGCKEAISEKDGLLVEKENTSMLIHAMDYMLDHRHKYNREEISRNNIQKYNRGIIGLDFIKLYDELGLS